LITATGWTWDYIDENMTLPRLASLTAYWRSHPPTHVIAAAFTGIKPQNAETDIMEGKGKKADFEDLPEYE